MLNEELPRHVAAHARIGRGGRPPLAARSGRARDPRRQRRRHRGMVGALVGLGHARIAFLAGPPSLLRGAPAHSPATGGASPTRASRSTSGWSSTTGFAAEDGARGVDTLARDRRRRSPPSAAPTTCSRSARCSGSTSSGIGVPGDVSVAGFDDIPIAAMTAPSLSTVRLPLREMGRRGFAIRRSRARRRAAEPDVLMPTTVVLRDSTAAPSRPPLGGQRA